MATITIRNIGSTNIVVYKRSGINPTAEMLQAQFVVNPGDVVSLDCDSLNDILVKERDYV